MRRDEICRQLRLALEPKEEILALWLEGADALDRVDEYSDLDICVSVTEGSMDSAELIIRRVLCEFSDLDHELVSQRSSDRRHLISHLAGTSVHALIDIDILVACGSEFFKDDPIEAPKVLFDKARVITFDVKNISGDELLAELDGLDKIINEHSRVEKYILRGEFLEAFGYYQKFVLTPLVQLARLVHTPNHHGYYIVHISRHLPESLLGQLEDLIKISALKTLEENLGIALSVYKKLAVELRKVHSPYH